MYIAKYHEFKNKGQKKPIAKDKTGRSNISDNSDIYTSNDILCSVFMMMCRDASIYRTNNTIDVSLCTI